MEKYMTLKETALELLRLRTDVYYYQALRAADELEGEILERANAQLQLSVEKLD